MTWDNVNQNHPHQPEQLHLETRIFVHYSSLEMRIEIRDVRCRTGLLIIRLRCELRIYDEIENALNAPWFIIIWRWSVAVRLRFLCHHLQKHQPSTIYHLPSILAHKCYESTFMWRIFQGKILISHPILCPSSSIAVARVIMRIVDFDIFILRRHHRKVLHIHPVEQAPSIRMQWHALMQHSYIHPHPSISISIHTSIAKRESPG